MYHPLHATRPSLALLSPSDQSFRAALLTQLDLHQIRFPQVISSDRILREAIRKQGQPVSPLRPFELACNRGGQTHLSILVDVLPDQPRLKHQSRLGRDDGRLGRFARDCTARRSQGSSSRTRGSEQGAMGQQPSLQLRTARQKADVTVRLLTCTEHPGRQTTERDAMRWYVCRWKGRMERATGCCTGSCNATSEGLLPTARMASLPFRPQRRLRTQSGPQQRKELTDGVLRLTGRLLIHT